MIVIDFVRVITLVILRHTTERYSYSPYNYINKSLHVNRFPGLSLMCKLVPVQKLEYENGQIIKSITALICVIVN